MSFICTMCQIFVSSSVLLVTTQSERGFNTNFKWTANSCVFSWVKILSHQYLIIHQITLENYKQKKSWQLDFQRKQVICSKRPTCFYFSQWTIIFVCAVLFFNRITLSNFQFSSSSVWGHAVHLLKCQLHLKRIYTVYHWWRKWHLCHFLFICPVNKSWLEISEWRQEKESVSNVSWCVCVCWHHIVGRHWCLSVSVSFKVTLSSLHSPSRQQLQEKWRDDGVDTSATSSHMRTTQLGRSETDFVSGLNESASCRGLLALAAAARWHR